MRVVVKIGSNILVGGRDTLNSRRIRSIAKAVSELSDSGTQVVIVSSGAIAAGMKRMGLKSRPREIMLKQAVAAVGQPALMWTYEKFFSEFKRKVAQVLLTRDGLSDRKMYINSKNTLNTLMGYGIIPIVNENDTVSTEEIRFGDNDQLAFMVAALTEADRLFMLSDVDGLYTADPRKSKAARLVPSVTKITDKMKQQASAAGSEFGTGGMYSKLLAAEKAMQSGIVVNIINGHRPGRMLSIIKGTAHGTEFEPEGKKFDARKSWIAFARRMRGTITLDRGAGKALTERGKSLLPSGIVEVEGKFETGDAVYCLDADKERIAKGLVNYSSDEIRKIMGKKTSQIQQALGYRYSDEVIHRDNLAVL